MSIEKLQEYLASMEFVYFRPDEVTGPMSHVKKGISNSVPPEEIWPNIVPVLSILDWLRRTGKFSRPLRITSSYRNAYYNYAVGGSPNSQHKAFRALDVKPVVPSDQVKLWVDRLAKELFRTRFSPQKDSIRCIPLPDRFDVPPRLPVLVEGVPSVPIHISKRYLRFTGGVGVYQTFVHVDCRGINNTWRGRA